MMNWNGERLSSQDSHSTDRETIAIAEVGAESAPKTSRYLKIGAACAGIAEISSEFHGNGNTSMHLLLGPHPDMVNAINGRTAYDYIHRNNYVADISDFAERHDRPFLVAYVNEPQKVYRRLQRLADERISVPVLLAIAGPSGFVVERMRDPETAFRRIDPIRDWEVIPEHQFADLAIATAGVVLHQAISCCNDELERSGLVAAYALTRPYRIDFPDEVSWPDLIQAISVPLVRASFKANTVDLIGCGSTGNWSDLNLAADAGVSVRRFDQDRYAESNLARQPLGIDHLGENKATTNAEACKTMDPTGHHHGYAHFIKDPADLEPLSDILLAMPDNDETRLLVADAAWQANRLMATAATGATSARIVVQEPGRACLRCLTGLGDSHVSTLEESSSCASVSQDSIVTTNMIGAALALCETREVLSGRPSRCLRFVGDVPVGNKLRKHVTDPGCSHLTTNIAHPRVSDPAGIS